MRSSKKKYQTPRKKLLSAIERNSKDISPGLVEQNKISIENNIGGHLDGCTRIENINHEFFWIWLSMLCEMVKSGLITETNDGWHYQQYSKSMELLSEDILNGLETEFESHKSVDMAPIYEAFNAYKKPTEEVLSAPVTPKRTVSPDSGLPLSSSSTASRNTSTKKGQRFLVSLMASLNSDFGYNEAKNSFSDEMPENYQSLGSYNSLMDLFRSGYFADRSVINNAFDGIIGHLANFGVEFPDPEGSQVPSDGASLGSIHSDKSLGGRRLFVEDDGSVDSKDPSYSGVREAIADGKVVTRGGIRGDSPKEGATVARDSSSTSIQGASQGEGQGPLDDDASLVSSLSAGSVKSDEPVLSPDAEKEMREKVSRLMVASPQEYGSVARDSSPTSIQGASHEVNTRGAHSKHAAQNRLFSMFSTLSMPIVGALLIGWDLLKLTAAAFKAVGGLLLNVLDFISLPIKGLLFLSWDGVKSGVSVCTLGKVDLNAPLGSKDITANIGVSQLDASGGPSSVGSVSTKLVPPA